MTPVIEVVCADVVNFSCDVLVLKYAQDFYGADELVASRLHNVSVINVPSLTPLPGDYVLVPSYEKVVAARAILFVGVRDLLEFRYGEIREFARSALHILARREPIVAHIAMTMHGIGIGLDESEAFLAQVAGLLDAVRLGDIPPALSKITIVEQNQGRAQRVQQLLDANNAGVIGNRYGSEEVKTPTLGRFSIPYTSQKQIDAGTNSNTKPHVFVAMPFRKDMEDIFYYGIQKPVKEAGYLCERMDMETFTGDILERIKERIETASLVIADLTGANANVYLEVGYAWGKGKPTLLIAKQGDQLKFDVQGQRCVMYETIRDLEQKLETDLKRWK